MLQEFKEFTLKGNVIDLAVGIIIGGAFGKIITVLVAAVIMPLIGLLMGGLDFSSLMIKVGHASIMYGLFIQSIVDFLIIAFSLFIFIRWFEKLKKKDAKEVAVEPAPPTAEQVILSEIRDLLRAQAQR